LVSALFDSLTATFKDITPIKTIAINKIDNIANNNRAFNDILFPVSFLTAIKTTKTL